MLSKKEVKELVQSGRVLSVEHCEICDSVSSITALVLAKDLKLYSLEVYMRLDHDEENYPFVLRLLNEDEKIVYKTFINHDNLVKNLEYLRKREKHFKVDV